MNSRITTGTAIPVGDPAGFPRTARLLRAKEYRAVFSNARFKASCRLFLLLAIPGENGAAKLGLVVSRKHVAGAVQRNRLKRLIRENFRKRQTQLRGANLVVLARKDAHKPANFAINSKLGKLLEDLLAKIRGAGAADSGTAQHDTAKREWP